MIQLIFNIVLIVLLIMIIIILLYFLNIRDEISYQFEEFSATLNRSHKKMNHRIELLEEMIDPQLKEIEKYLHDAKKTKKVH